VRFQEAVARLSSLPDVLPAGPAALDPRVLARLGSAPAWARAAATAPSRDAAALILLYPGADGDAHLVLIERPGGDVAHAGQVALPGGKREAGDDFPVGTAIREATEEIGLDPVGAGLRVLGVLETVDVRVSGFLLVPVLAVAERSPRLVADPLEVARIIEVPVRHFLPRAPIEIVEDQRDGWRLRYGAFPVGEHRVWGATARILGQLGSVLGDE
jgi:8-oxo-dGTP pyrophosphatase MutT (NUDIX family)